jgi:hypothetical protein
MATTSVRPSPASTPTGYDRGEGWVLFAAIMIGFVAIMNVIYGIAAIDKSGFFVNDQKYIFSDLRTWGWIILVIGLLQVLAAGSIWRGGAFGRWFGIGTAGVNAIAALLSIPGYPLWSLAIFAVDVMIIYALAAYGGDRRYAVG